jgi:hypothetical protein
VWRSILRYKLLLLVWAVWRALYVVGDCSARWR